VININKNISSTSILQVNRRTHIHIINRSSVVSELSYLCLCYTSMWNQRTMIWYDYDVLWVIMLTHWAYMIWRCYIFRNVVIPVIMLFIIYNYNYNYTMYGILTLMYQYKIIGKLIIAKINYRLSDRFTLCLSNQWWIIQVLYLIVCSTYSLKLMIFLLSPYINYGNG
jgi:hypothetical protein